MTRTRAAVRRGRKESCQEVRPPASWQGATLFATSRWLPALLCHSRGTTHRNPGRIPGVSTRSGDKFPPVPPHPGHDERTSHPSAVVVLRRPCQETELPVSWQGAPSCSTGAAVSVPAAPGVLAGRWAS